MIRRRHEFLVTRTACARVLLTLLLGGLVSQALPQSAPVPTVDEIIRRLTRPAPGEEDLRSRAVQVEGRRERTEPSSPASIDLTVNFEFDSARLTPDARIVLDNLGQALADPALRDSRFVVAGHTDARGGDAYNLELSRQRARSVADYLVRQHRVRAERLSVEGHGRTRLLDPASPESAVNRRVQITNLGP